MVGKKGLKRSSAVNLDPWTFFVTPGTIWSKIVHQNHCSEIFSKISDFGAFLTGLILIRDDTVQ